MFAKLKALAIEVHKTSFSVWYGYLVLISMTLQESWADLNDYCPPKWRHGIIGAATLVLFIDKTRRALKAVNQGNPPP